MAEVRNTTKWFFSIAACFREIFPKEARYIKLDAHVDLLSGDDNLRFIFGKGVRAILFAVD